MQNKNIENESLTKTPEINPSKRRKLIASFLLGMGIVIGAHNVAKVNDEQRFPEGYRATPTTEQASVMQASSAVEVTDADKLATEQSQTPEAPLKEPYVTATHSVEVPSATTIDTQDVKLSPEDQAALDQHWKNFEKVHEGHPMNVNDVSAYSEK